MKQIQTMLITEKDLKKQLLEALEEFEQRKREQAPEKVFTVNQVARLLGMAHATVKKKVLRGIIRSTPDGLIPASALDEYLQKGKGER